VLLPVVAVRLRGDAGPCCALDGTPLVPLYRVRIVDAARQSRAFCCIGCAEIWLQHQAEGARAVFVTDETSGDEIEATSATFVRSLVVTTPTTGNRLHTFRDRADAEKHAARWQGTVLTTAERPFAPAGISPVTGG
jgi:hypothetical protein